MKKRYRAAPDIRLVFPDGQTVDGDTEFEREYDPVQEAQHLHGGHITVVGDVPELEPVKPKRGRTVEVKEDSDG
jgi:hypothetical protein